MQTLRWDTEVVDKMCVSAMRVANVEEIIGGRLRLQYADTKVRYRGTYGIYFVCLTLKLDLYDLNNLQIH